MKDFKIKIKDFIFDNKIVKNIQKWLDNISSKISLKIHNITTNGIGERTMFRW